MKQLVLDTNVLVSGLLSAANPPGRIVDALRAGIVQLVLDDRIFLEYEDVLRRPKFTNLIQSVEREWILDHIYHSSRHVAVAHTAFSLPDPADIFFLEVAAAVRVPLIAGNLKHFPTNQRHGVRVLSPADFLRTTIG